jgi:Fe-S oxidoreductase
MTADNLRIHLDGLAKCRFCPMCKPAAEVANLTLIESHSTRARAMMMWRIGAGLATWRPRDVELLYQSTLDSIAEAWCVSHYAFHDFMAAARADVFESGLAPEAVQHVAERDPFHPTNAKGSTILLASEAAELGDESAVDPALHLLESCGVHAGPLLAMSGALANSLGARQKARTQAAQVVHLLEQGNVSTVIVDGPVTMQALQRMYPALSVAVPSRVAVISLAAVVETAIREGRLQPPHYGGAAAFVHDSRSSCLLADRLAQAEAVQPGYRGPEEISGEGEVYAVVRRLADAVGLERRYSVWSRSLSRSCGADDGLWLTYPDLAEGLAKQRLEEARRLGASIVVTDSLLCARHLERFAGGSGVQVRWLPEMVVAS